MQIIKSNDSIDLDTKGHRYAIVVARFNPKITEGLLQGALEALRENGVAEESIHIVKVPGAFELPLVSKKLAQTGRFDAIVALGAIIRGETSHFDFVANQSAAGVLDASLSTGVPIMYGILTTDNVQQAEARSTKKEGNCGYHYTLGAIEMVNVLKKIL